MKKLYFVILSLFLTLLPINAETLQAGVSVEYVPKALFGNWRVEAKLEDTNSLSRFKPQSLDMWYLERNGDSISLQNPYSKANSTISIKTVEDNLIVFSKKNPFDDNKILTDTVTIRIDGNKFSGINELKLESFSFVDKHLMKTETATYRIKGEKISGDTIF